MSNEKDEIIMYDSPEAAEQITLTGWVSKGKHGRFWYKDEHMARWAGCTHLKCECGNIMSKSWTKCDECRRKLANERYQKLQFKEWDGQEPVCERDGDKYFFSEGELIDYIYDHNEENPDDKITEIDLLICDPINYHEVDLEQICGETHDDWEPEDELVAAKKAFDEVVKKLPPHSWTPGKIRTTYKYFEQ